MSEEGTVTVFLKTEAAVLVDVVLKMYDTQRRTVTMINSHLSKHGKTEAEAKDDERKTELNHFKGAHLIHSPHGDPSQREGFPGGEISS